MLRRDPRRPPSAGASTFDVLDATEDAVSGRSGRRMLRQFNLSELPTLSCSKVWNAVQENCSTGIGNMQQYLAFHVDIPKRWANLNVI
jgi:hypothetical protein